LEKENDGTVDANIPVFFLRRSRRSRSSRGGRRGGRRKEFQKRKKRERKQGLIFSRTISYLVEWTAFEKKGGEEGRTKERKGGAVNLSKMQYTFPRSEAVRTTRCVIEGLAYRERKKAKKKGGKRPFFYYLPAAKADKYGRKGKRGEGKKKLRKEKRKGEYLLAFDIQPDCSIRTVGMGKKKGEKKKSVRRRRGRSANRNRLSVFRFEGEAPEERGGRGEREVREKRKGVAFKFSHILIVIRSRAKCG